ncbi:MAG: tripartite tricarboxylate transporter substrate binding protein [Comamonadaceae bacterium]|nr:MAG: tripartite tricarboxylate transporter substrate binding protein [Comamonadaceae bacterium]
MNRFGFISGAAGAVVLAACSSSAMADDYPSRPIELLIPYAVGGGTDAVGRAFADAASRYVPQGMVVVNRPGAAGAIGHAEGARAPADGYKLTMVTPEINLAYLQGIGKTKYQEFTYIARLNIDPVVLIVPTTSPYKTLEDVLAKAKTKPGEMALANSGKGSTYHLAAIALEEKTGLSFNNIPYIGAGPEMIAILGNQVEGGFATTGEAGTYVKAGKFRLLGVMAPERLKEFPDVPTFKERGIDIQQGTWRALAVPKGTPPSVVARIKDVAQKVSQEPKYQQFFARQYLGMVYEDGDKFASELDREFKSYSDIVTKLQPK